VSQVICLFNQAGGVGKSTLAINLGYHLTQLKPPKVKRNFRVLLVDVDPQSSLTNFMGIDPTEQEKTIYDALIDQEPLPILSDVHGMDFVPANQDLSSAELELVVADMRDLRLKFALEPVQKQYDFILLDCPPSLGILSYISLVASTHVLVPIQTQYKAFLGTELLLNTVARVRSLPNRDLKFAGFIPTMYDSRNSQDERTLKAIQEQLSNIGEVFDPIPRSTAFADAAEENVPLALFSPKHPAVAQMQKVAKSLGKRI
jgi:chromosome partitioning protein